MGILSRNIAVIPMKDILLGIILLWRYASILMGSRCLWFIQDLQQSVYVLHLITYHRYLMPLPGELLFYLVSE